MGINLLNIGQIACSSIQIINVKFRIETPSAILCVMAPLRAPSRSLLTKSSYHASVENLTKQD